MFSSSFVPGFSCKFGEFRPFLFLVLVLFQSIAIIFVELLTVEFLEESGVGNDVSLGTNLERFT